MNLSLSLRSSVQKLLCVCFVLLAGGAWAQEAKVRTSLATNGTIWVGQKVTLIVELLAPGYFAGAATFDLPDPQGILLVPPMEHPVVSNETIDDTSFTVQRHELSAFAMRSGEQSVPPLKVRFSFKRAPLDTNQIPATVTTPPLPFKAQLPPGTENLGTVISARDLEAEEVWQPEPDKTNVMAGAAFQRTITFGAPEVPGMVFPPFPAGQIDGLGIYTKRQVLDHSDRGELRGERRDVITYICQRPGQFTIPAARLVWFDLEAKSLRTNDFQAHTLTVVPNPALSADATNRTADSTKAGSVRQPVSSWKQAAVIVLILLALVLLSWPRLRRSVALLLAPMRPVHLQALNPPIKA